MKKKASSPKGKVKQPQGRRVLFYLKSGTPLLIAYLLFADSGSLPEIVAGFCTALIAAGFIALLPRRYEYRYRVRAGWFPLLILRVTWKWLLDTALVLHTLWDYALRRKPIEGDFVPMPVHIGKDEPYARARLAIIMALSTVPPNSVSILLDQEKGCILLHRLVKKTGSKPVGGNPEWPL